MKYIFSIYLLITITSCDNRIKTGETLNGEPIYVTEEKELTIEEISKNWEAEANKPKIEILLDGEITEPFIVSTNTTTDEHSVRTITKSNKTMKWVLSQKESFSVASLTQRIYKIKEDGGQETILSTPIDISPESNTLRNEYTTEMLFDILEKGKYKLQFLKGDSIIANAMFILE